MPEKKKITVTLLKIRTLEIFAVIILKVECLVYNKVMCLKDADGMANSVDPDQTAPLGAV